MYSTTEKLWEVASERQLTNKDKNGEEWKKNFVPWKFRDDAPLGTPTVLKISFPFWAGYKDYEVSWIYDSSSNSYKRENGGAPHLDFNNQEQITASNVVIIFTSLKGPIDELKHVLYTTTGKGKALVFQNGGVTEGTWSKDSRTARTRFVDKKGNEIEFTRGPIWIEVLDTGTEVEY
jgi:hypothetical protein